MFMQTQATTIKTYKDPSTLADFKRRIKRGVILRGWRYDAQGNVTDLGIRHIDLVQKNCFALESHVQGARKLSYCEYPKAHLIEWVDKNTVNIYQEEAVGRFPTVEKPTKKAVLTYEFMNG
jgi:hypothetical protein